MLPQCIFFVKLIVVNKILSFACECIGYILYYVLIP